MNFNELAAARYSVRSFKSEPISEEKIAYINKAAILAPSANNNQPWRMILVDDKEMMDRLRECTPCHYNAPLAYVMCYTSAGTFVRSDDNLSAGPIDASIAATQMILAAKEQGVDSCWVMMFDLAKTKELLEIPQEVTPIAILVMGYAADGSKPSPKHTIYRKESELIHHNKY